jgi:hypothetical protein
VPVTAQVTRAYGGRHDDRAGLAFGGAERHDPLGLGASVDPRLNLLTKRGALGVDLDARIAE